LLCGLIFNSCNNKPNLGDISEETPKFRKKNYDTITRNGLLKEAAQYAYDKRFYEINKTIALQSESIKDTVGIITAQSNIGLYFFNRFDNDSAYYYFSKAERLSGKLKEKPLMSEILQSKADLRWCQKDFSGAELTAIKALKNAKNNNRVIYSCYITLANSLAGMNKYEKALKYYDKALLKLEELKKLPQYSILKAQAQNYIAQIYQKQNSPQKAIDYLDKNINLKKLKAEDLKMYCYIKNTLAYSKFMLNDKSALPLFKEVLHIADSTKFSPTQAAVKINLSKYYLTQKDTATALFYGKSAQEIAHRNDIFEDELKALQLLANIVPDKQFMYSERYIHLNDSLQNIERATRDKFAMIEFETNEITTEKKAIEKQRNRLLYRIWIIVCFSSLLLMVIILWFKNKSQKAKTRELIMEQEHQKDKEEIYKLMLSQQQKIEEGKQIEKKRISQELHDGVMGKLSSIRMNLYVLNKKSDPETIAKCLEYIKEIQGIEKEIRTISHDLSKNIFSDSVNFISIVENLFTAIKNHAEIDFSLKVDERIDWETVDNKAKINIYRIIQEILQNIDKYANAKNVSIKMDKKENIITIEIRDDGIGFNINRQKKGIGITNMQARMREINGGFKIESQPKKGTKIILTIPN
jgi:signal transduction histidine kinase